MAEFIILGDLHEGCYPKGVAASFSYLTSIFQQVEDYALKHGIDTAVQLGDIHDGVGVSEESRFFMMEMFSKSRLSWKIYFGNHDYLSAEYNTLQYYQKMQKFGLLKNCEFFTEPTITKFKGMPTAFLPWPHHKVKSKEPMLCFGHFAKAGAKGDNGYVIKGETEISSKHEWIIGDLHTYQKGSNYTYIGAPLQLKYGDTAKRYFGHFKGNLAKPKILRVPIQLPYRLQQLTCTSEVEIAKLIKNLADRDANVYTKLKLGEEVLTDYRYDEIKNTERVTVEFAGKIKEVKEGEDVVVLIDSKSVRLELVKKRLKKKGFSADAIKRALDIVSELEAGE